MNIGIIGIERVEQNGMVVKVHWQASDRNNDAYAFESGTVMLPEKTVNDPTFVLFENLTEKLVLEWVKPNLDLEQIQELLDKKMQNVKSLKLINGVPNNWAS